MLIEIILFVFLGLIAGTITGLIPGIHINLISTTIISISTIFFIQPIYAISFITSMAITHTFIDFIPSIFLGCPDTDTELGVLPGHRMLMNKRGFEAIYLSAIGSMLAIILTIIILFPSVIILKHTYTTIENIVPILLIIFSIILIISQKEKKKATLIFLLTGFLGFTTSQLEINQPLLPLLSGLFGVSNIYLSIKNKIKIPEQIITKPKIKIKKPIITSILSAPFCSFLPSFGSGQAAVFGNLIKKHSEKEFLILLGIINTLIMTFSFISLYTINKTRTGTTLAIKELINILEKKHLILIIIITIIVGFLSFFLTLILAKLISKNLNKINYKYLSISTIIIISMVTFLISNFTGLIVLVISTLTGIYTIQNNIQRTNMIGCLTIPTIIWLIF